MAADVAQRLIKRYLKELRDSTRGLTRGERRELITQIDEHIRTALPPNPTEAQVRDVLERLGEPDEIVTEQYGARASPTAMGAQAVSAIVLLLIGGFLAGIGWIAGVVLLWTSHAWTVRDKLVGTLILPGGLGGSLYLASAFFLSAGGACFGGKLSRSGHVVGAIQRCTPAPSTAHIVLDVALLTLTVGAPIATAVFLARRARPLPA